MSETELWRRYRAGKSYQNAMGFTQSFPQCIDFCEGRQWPAATPATRSLPRPVFNYCDKYVRTKRANVLNQPVRLVFSPAAGNTDTELAAAGARAYTDFAASLWRELGQDELNEDMLTDAATLGTGILHYYWDPDAGEGSLRGCGALRGEVLDPLTVMFSDPQECDVQRQRYILIATRVPVERLRGEAMSQGMPMQVIRQIVPDSEEPDTYEASRRENSVEKKCTLLTMYYRLGGCVYFDRATRAVTLTECRALTPGMRAGESFPGSAMRRYPVAVMQWRRRKRSIYGIGEVEGMIPTQKAINWLMGMNILSVQDTAWPKIVVKPGALRQELSNTPGEIIEDHSATGAGVRYLEPPGISGAAMALTEKLGSLMQDSAGVTEVVTGDPYTANMAASAIIALQNQAKQPIVSVQKRFYRVIEQVGRIWEEFFRSCYTLPRAVRAADGGVISFVGTDFAAADFALDVDAGAGSEYSESLSQSMLDKLYDGGAIDLETYVQLCSENVMPFKTEIRRYLREKRERQTLDTIIKGDEPTDELPLL